MAKTAIGESFIFLGFFIFFFKFKRRLNSKRFFCVEIFLFIYFVSASSPVRGDVGGAVATPMSQKDAGR